MIDERSENVHFFIVAFVVRAMAAILLIGIGLMVAGLWRWLNSFRADKKFVALCLCGVLAMGAGGLGCYRYIHFSPGVWKVLDPDNRYYQARDLVLSKRLTGMKKDEVFALLGAEDIQTRPDRLTYLTANGSLFLLNRFALEIYFDMETEQVKQVKFYDTYID